MVSNKITTVSMVEVIDFLSIFFLDEHISDVVLPLPRQRHATFSDSKDLH